MTELLELFNKIAEYYGQTAAIIIIATLVIVYAAFLMMKNFSAVMKNSWQSEKKEQDKIHVDAAKHRKNITPKIRTELAELAEEVGADRALLFEYSNGSSNLIGLPFLYASATCEVVTPGTSPVSYQYQRINTALVAEFLEKLEDKTYFYVSSLEEIKDEFPTLYNFMGPNNVHSALFYTLRGMHDTIGFVVVTTTGKRSFTREDCLPRVASSSQMVSSLLNFDMLHEKL